MNERIRELRAKALVPIQKDGYTSWVFSEDKFAELIVRECLSYMKDGDIDFAKFMIKKHFGVKE